VFCATGTGNHETEGFSIFDLVFEIRNVYLTASATKCGGLVTMRAVPIDDKRLSEHIESHAAALCHDRADIIFGV